MKLVTTEEWDARQSVICKVVDAETGRANLIMGDGEVLEETVTKQLHRLINKQAILEYGWPCLPHVSRPVSLRALASQGLVAWRLIDAAAFPPVGDL